MKNYKLDFGWEIGFPEDWEHEVDEKGVDVFYPPNDFTKVYASADTFANKKGMPAPAEIAEDYFVQMLTPYNAEEIPLDVDGLGCRAFYCVYNDCKSEEIPLDADSLGCRELYCVDKRVYRIGVGIFTKGTLLSLDVYSENEDKVFEVAELFFCKARFGG